MAVEVSVVLAIYLGLILLVGFRSGRKSKENPESFFVADRRLNWIQEGSSIFSTAANGGALLGTVGQFYGIKGPFLGYAIGYMVLAPAALWVVGSRLRRLGVAHGYQTQADFFRHFMRSRTLAVCSTVLGVGLVMVYLSTSPIAVASALEEYTGLDYLLAVGLFLVVALSYTMYGGLRAVADTDVFHGAVLAVFLVLMVVTLFVQAGGPGEIFGAEGNAAFLSVTDTADGALVFLPWAVILGMSLISLPDRALRIFSVRDERNLRRTVLITAAAMGLASVSFFLTSMALSILVPDVTSTDTAVVTGIEEYAPWLVALFMMNVFGSALAQASMQMLTVANLFVRDVLGRRARAADAGGAGMADGSAILVARILMLVTAIVGFIVAAEQPDIWSVVGAALGIFAQLGIGIAFGLLWRRTTSIGAIAGLAVGLVLILQWRYLGDAPWGMQAPDSLALVANAAVLVVVSLLTSSHRRADPAAEGDVSRAAPAVAEAPESVAVTSARP